MPDDHAAHMLQLMHRAERIAQLGRHVLSRWYPGITDAVYVALCESCRGYVLIDAMVVPGSGRDIAGPVVDSECEANRC